jgi:DNA replication protein DnaC
MNAPAPTVTPEMRALLRRLKLGRTLDTLPERLALAKTRSLSHAEFLELVLADEVTRRDTTSAALRARTAGLDPAMCLENWDDTAAVTYDHTTFDELCSLRFVDAAHNVVIMGPVGVGKTFLATALGHAAVRRRMTVHFERADRLLKRLKASRLDNSHEVELRKLLRVDLLILDDFCLQPLDAIDTADIYELIVERHRTAATLTTSNREPIEWLGLMADPYWHSPQSTDSSRPHTNSPSTATAIASARSRRQANLPAPPQPPGDGGALDPRSVIPDDLQADADDSDPVPCYWRTGGPFELAGDIDVETAPENITEGARWATL